MTSVLIKLYGRLCTLIPVFGKISRKWMYEAMSLVITQDHWVFMNYGFVALNGSDLKPVLDSSDEAHRLPYQLYDHLTAGIDLKNKFVLEIGCGRGGGASMIEKYHKPEKIIGLDFSYFAIKFCNKNLKREGLSFVKGDAENLPFGHESFDAVINVESSHCYGSMNRFLAEVKKVLKPGGHFLFADFRKNGTMNVLEKQLHDSGMKVLEKRDITSNVLSALDEDHERRMQEISEYVPKPFIRQFREFAGVKDSVIYKSFKSGNAVYFSYVLQKS